MIVVGEWVGTIFSFVSFVSVWVGTCGFLDDHTCRLKSIRIGLPIVVELLRVCAGSCLIFAAQNRSRRRNPL